MNRSLALLTQIVASLALASHAEAGGVSFKSGVAYRVPQDGKRGLAAIPPTTAAKRLALVIGNDAYPRTALKNAVNDAKSMETALQGAGFTVSLALNANLKNLDQAINGYLDTVQPGDVALIYYSGHGIQIQGENFLVPVDFAANDQAEARYQAYSASKLLDLMQDRGARLNILVLDACRDNPFRSVRSASGGLAAMDAGKGSYIAFSTAPGRTASDNQNGVNGLFTGFLVEQLGQTGLTLDEVFNHVREKVIEISNSAQVPWSATSVVGSFVFRDPKIEEERVRAQTAALEDQLRQLQRAEAEARKQQADQEVTRKQQEEAAVQARLDFERREQVRLQKEREARDEVNHNAASEKAEEERLVELRRQVEAQQSKVKELHQGGLTQAEAQSQIASLNSEIEKTRSMVEAARQQAIRDLDASFEPARQNLKRTAERDQFETTAQYEARMPAHKSEEQELDSKYKSGRVEIDKRYNIELLAQTRPYQDQVSELWSSHVAPALKVELKGYIADSGILTAAIGNKLYDFQIDPAKAKDLYARQTTIQVRQASPGEPVDLFDPATRQLIGGGPHQTSAGETKLNPKDGLIYAWIPPGTFMMGCSPGDNECDENEKPTRRVSIPKGFWLGQTPVTQAAFRRIMRDFRFDDYYPHYLKVDIPESDDSYRGADWIQASHHCEAVDGRLPTEAEWEYAARAGTMDARSQDQHLRELIEKFYAGSMMHSLPVKQTPPNAWNLYDMIGLFGELTASIRPGAGGMHWVIVRGGWKTYITHEGSLPPVHSDSERASASSRDEFYSNQGAFSFRCAWE